MVVSESIMLSNSLNDFMYYTQSRSWKVPTEHFGSVDAAKQLRYRRIRPAVHIGSGTSSTETRQV